MHSTGAYHAGGVMKARPIFSGLINLDIAYSSGLIPLFLALV